jgi:hypothetical protein
MAFTAKDFKDMDDMLRRAMEAHTAGTISAAAVQSGMAHIMAAIDLGNFEEVRKWFTQNGVEYFQDVDSRI